MRRYSTVFDGNEFIYSFPQLTFTFFIRNHSTIPPLINLLRLLCRFLIVLYRLMLTPIPVLSIIRRRNRSDLTAGLVKDQAHSAATKHLHPQHQGFYIHSNN